LFMVVRPLMSLFDFFLFHLVDPFKTAPPFRLSFLRIKSPYQYVYLTYFLRQRFLPLFPSSTRTGNGAFSPFPSLLSPCSRLLIGAATCFCLDSSPWYAPASILFLRLFPLPYREQREVRPSYHAHFGPRRISHYLLVSFSFYAFSVFSSLLL